MNKLNDQFNFCLSHKCGNSSVVEHYLAKVRVAGSNPVSRSSKTAVNKAFLVISS